MKMFSVRMAAAGCGLLLSSFSVTPASHSFAGDWRQFRGNAADSVAAGESLPTELSGSTIAWKSELPGRGLSGPIIVNDRVFLSASSG